MTELEIIELARRVLKSPPSPEGPGDDCAVLRLANGESLLLAVDQVVADVHYNNDSTSPAEIAVKLLNRNLSDIAAMGGRPMRAVVAMALSEPKPKEWFEAFFSALGNEAERWKLQIVGGDVASNPSGGDVFSLSVIGESPAGTLCERGNAKHGDALFATGLFGRSLPTGHHLRFSPRLEESAFLAGKFTTAIIDVSDGLLLDSARMSEASDVGVVLEAEAIPRRDGATLDEALKDGEDYELLLAVPPSQEKRLLREWPFQTRLTRIGTFSNTTRGVTVRCGDNASVDGKTEGFVHFADNPKRGAAHPQ